MSDHDSRPREVENGTTMMLVPIKSPTDSSKAIGILRFVDKKHSEAPDDTIDYFNNADEDLLQHARQSLALIVKSFLEGKEHVRQFARISHEVRAPSIAILSHLTPIARIVMHSDIDCELEKTSRLSRERLIEYFEVIESSASLLQYQSESSLLYSYLLKADRRSPLDKIYLRYSEKVSIMNLINESRTIVIPIAKATGVRFANIKLYVNHCNKCDRWRPECGDTELYLDKKAFLMVFYNILVNAIKYHRPGYKDRFWADVTFERLAGDKDKGARYSIIFQDNGIGIDDEQKVNILG